MDITLIYLNLNLFLVVALKNFNQKRLINQHFHTYDVLIRGAEFLFYIDDIHIYSGNNQGLVNGNTIFIWSGGGEWTSNINCL